jgi:adenylate cyclase
MPAVSDPKDKAMELEARTKAAERRSRKLREAAVRTDSRPRLVETAKLLRSLLPGDSRYGDAVTTTEDKLPQHLGRVVSELRSERPSAIRELGLGALQAWQALSEAQRRGRGHADVAILFTDLVGFSAWALEAGDDTALEMLRQVGDAEDAAIPTHAGAIVKRLGDGAMAVFSHPQGAVEAALELQRSMTEIRVEGHTPKLRAGVHLGRPRRIGRDYLGVDVNVAARVGEAAKAGQVLVSESAREGLDPAAFTFGRRRRLRAAGVPRELSVSTVSAGDATRAA